MAHIPRLFVPADLHKDIICDLEEGQSKYLIKVMRLKSDSLVRAFNGRGGEWACSLHIDGRIAKLQPQRQLRAQVERADLTLLFAPLKKTRTDFVIEKACELGVSAIQPVITDYTQSQRVRADRLIALAIEAAEQTERLDIPNVFDALPLPKALEAWPATKGLIYCDEAGEAKPMAEALPGLQPQPKGLLIGPEGGFSLKERTYLRALSFVQPVTLGPRILRAETAALSALTLWQSILGDWQKRPYVPEIDHAGEGSV